MKLVFHVLHFVLLLLFLSNSFVVYNKWSQRQVSVAQSVQKADSRQAFPSVTFAWINLNGPVSSWSSDLSITDYLPEVVLHNPYINLTYSNDTSKYYALFRDPTKGEALITINLDEVELQNTPDVQTQLLISVDISRLPEAAPYLRFFVHPAGHFRYGYSYFYGAATLFLSISDVARGEQDLYSVYSFDVTKKELLGIDRPCEENNKQNVVSCLRRHVETELGCSLPWQTGNGGEGAGGNACSTEEDWRRFRRVIKQLKKTAVVCPMNCHIDLYEVTQVQAHVTDKSPTEVKAGSPSLATVVLLSDQQEVPLEREVLLYDTSDMIADVGGFLGLLLGASIVSILKAAMEGATGVWKALELKTFKEKTLMGHSLKV